MFGKRREAPTLIGPGAAIEGTVRVNGPLHIDGEVHGRIEAAGPISIGPKGVVEGEVHGESVAIAGHVYGVVHASGHLHMLVGGQVRGDVFYDTIQIERGGSIDGRMTQLDETNGTASVQTHEEPAADESMAEVAELAAAGSRRKG